MAVSKCELEWELKEIFPLDSNHEKVKQEVASHLELERARTYCLLCGKLPTVHFIPMRLHISGVAALHYALKKKIV